MTDSQTSSPPPSSDTVTVFEGGAVWDPAHPDTDRQTLAVQGGRIVAVGPEAVHDAIAGAAEVERVDLGGGMLLPAFGDGHAHPINGGLEQIGPRIRECHSVAEIVASVSAFARDNPDREWIIGGSYDSALAPNAVFDANWLDEAVPDRPVLLHAWDYHTVWCNSLALAAGGIQASTPEPSDGNILRRDDGSPVGTLHEFTAVNLVLDQATARTEDELDAALLFAADQFAAAGVTWVQDAWVDPHMVPAYERWSARGHGVRFNLALRADPAYWREQFDFFTATRDRLHATGTEVTCNTVKFFADGIIENHTAAMIAPYGDDPHSRGKPVWTAAELTAAVAQADALGFQAHIHAIGDQAARTALDSLEALAATNGERDRRSVITHLQVVDSEDIKRLGALRVIANFEPLWACLDSAMVDLMRPRLGSQLQDRQYEIASVIGAGAIVSFGSDWPVTSLNPLEGLAVGASRQTLDGAGPSWMADERVDLTSAFAAYTGAVAYQAFEEDQWGALRPGLRADLVWLGRDPRTVDPIAVAAIPILATWAKGQRIYTRS